MSAIGPSKIELIKNLLDWNLAEHASLAADIAVLKGFLKSKKPVDQSDRVQKEHSRPNIRLMV